MKLNKFLGGLALTAMLGAGFASCSNEMDSRTPEALGDMLVRAPKAVAYSGDTYHTPGFGTRSAFTRAGEGVTSQECKTKYIDREKEKEFIEEKLPEKNGNISDDMSTDCLFYAEGETTFELYPVFSQTTTPNSFGVFYYDADGNYHEVIVWDNVEPWSLTETNWSEPVEDSWVEDPNHYSGNGGYYSQYGVTYSKGVQVTIPAGCTFGFYWKGHNNTGETVYYSDSDKNEEVNRTDGDGNPIGGTETIHAVTFEHDGKTYLGFEDWTDFDYQDWVFTCNTVLKKSNGTPETPETPEEPKEPELCPNPDCNHPVHGEGHCDECGPFQGCNKPGAIDPGNLPDFTVDPDPETPETPDVPGFDKATNEVEVNLALDEKESDILSSHLSIHVRAATDVEIFIPVPAKYYCDADDMEIVMSHEPNHMGHGGPHQFTWTLKDSDLQVSLFVQYEEEGIRIWTDGITQEVIDWCYEKCNDGITFEVWNYFNDPETGEQLLSMEELRSYLDQATIKFLDEIPDYYINSFGPDNGKYDKNDPGALDKDDFHVTPVEQGNAFDAPYEGPHQNNSDNNDIYKKKDVVVEEPAPTPPPVPVY